MGIPGQWIISKHILDSPHIDQVTLTCNFKGRPKSDKTELQWLQHGSAPVNWDRKQTNKRPWENTHYFSQRFSQSLYINEITPFQFSKEFLRNAIFGLAFLKDLQCSYLAVQRKLLVLQLSLNPSELLQVTSLLCPSLPGQKVSWFCFPLNY